MGKFITYIIEYKYIAETGDFVYETKPFRTDNLVQEEYLMYIESEIRAKNGNFEEFEIIDIKIDYE